MSTSSISSPSPRSKPNDENNWLRIIKTDHIEYRLTSFIEDYYKEICKLKNKIHNICYRGDSDEESYNEDSNIESYSKDLNSLELIYNRLIQYKKELLKSTNILESQLPRISMHDPVARYYGLLREDIIKIIRKSETAGEYVTYRICI